MTATMIAATDEAIFRDTAEVFPSLGVKIRLSTAYTLAPPIFVFLHINALLQTHLLATRLRALNAALSKEPTVVRQAWRHLLHGLAFVQLLSKTEWSADRQPRPLLAFVTWLALVAVPLTLLVTAQVSFVRYQSWAITVVHQISLGVDVGLLLWLHRSLLDQTTRGKWAARIWGAMAGLGALALETLSLTQAIPPGPDLTSQQVWVLNNSTQAWFGGALDWTSHQYAWRWTSRYLDLRDQTLINNEAKPDLLKPFLDGVAEIGDAQRKMVALNLSGRSFRYGRFDRAQIFAANFSNIKAEKSSWNQTRLQGANFIRANLKESELSSALLQRSIFGLALLQQAKFYNTSLEEANLTRASLQGAFLSGAKLQGAKFQLTKLQGAYLDNAKLQGAELDRTELQGADLSKANLKGAFIGSAKLQGAYLITTERSSTVGQPASCNSLISSDQLPVNSITTDELDTLLAQAGVGEERRSIVVKLYKSAPPSVCDGVAISAARSLPQPDHFARNILQAACEDVDTASGILERMQAHNDNPDIRALRLAALTAFAGSAEPNCPGVFGLDRRKLDKAVASLK